MSRRPSASTSVLSARATGTAPIRSASTQIVAMNKARVGDKSEFTKIMQVGNLETYGMSVRLSPQEIQSFSADQLYELAYGGSTDYWRSPVFTSHRREEIDYVSDLTREINVVESIYSCPSCSYDRILVRQEQKGGGDESMTAMFRCAKCGHGWSDSGRG